MGYTGKQVIHPKQVEIVQTAFLPNEKKVKWAEELLKAYEEHQKSGKVCRLDDLKQKLEKNVLFQGAFVFEKQMIDAPTMKQAKNILDQHKRTRKS